LLDGELGQWLLAQPVAGASHLVAAVRGAAQALPVAAERERWVLFLGDGFASTGFRRAGEVEQAIAESIGGATHVTTIGIGTDSDAALLSAAARGGGGSYLAWVPGQSVKAAAIAGLESTFGPVLRDATVTLPAGLADVAPAVLPTIRSGQEVLIASRIEPGVEQLRGEVILRGTLGGQPFEQRYPIELVVSRAAGNAFVPRLWAQLAIEQLEQRGGGEQRPRIVALSQGYGVMSRETSLLVLESAAMFEAFGVDRTVPAAKWTGQEALDEIVASGAFADGHGGSGEVALGKGSADPAKKRKDSILAGDNDEPREAMRRPAVQDPFATPAPKVPRPAAATPPPGRGREGGFAMRRTWVRVPALVPYDGKSDAIAAVLGESERALARTPDSRERHRALVQALSYAGELPRAQQLAARWLERDRLDPQALGYQADLLGRTGQRAAALRVLAGIVDLDADRKDAHQRLATAYEQVGQHGQACAHRIALSTLDPRDGKAGAAAMRCLTALARGGDVERVRRGLADDATRDLAERELASAPAVASGKRELLIGARWEGGEDLELSLITPEGTRISWMGGHPLARVSNATSTTSEALTLRTIKRGNYLVEIGRAEASDSTAGATSGRGGLQRGSIDLAVLGVTRTLPFELAPGEVRKIIGRVAVQLQERIESIDPSATQISLGTISDATARRVILARSQSLQRCFARYLVQHPGARGRMTLNIFVGSGATSTRVSAAADLGDPARCIEAELASMHLSGPRRTLRVPLSFAAP
ncbi:MAG TPA: hypothetical protein PKU97_18595, partial [Kofleriaceae bacterium]|nr:hypothetical protein [Kofleriaceae bacterium]